MDTNVIAYGVGITLVLFLGLANLIVTWQTKRIVEDVLGRDSQQASFGKPGVTSPGPGSSPAPAASAPAVEPTERAAQAAPRSSPGTATLPSMPAIVPASARPAPTVDVVAARFRAAGGTPGADDDGPTLNQTDDGPARG